MAFISSVDKRRLGQLKTVRVADPFYDDCGQTKTCFGSPDGCVSTQDCVAVTAVRAEGTRYVFELKARNAGYVAVGISDDKKMVRRRDVILTVVIKRELSAFVVFKCRDEFVELICG